MLHKNPKPAYIRYIRRGARVVFVAEAFFFVATFATWYRLNTNRDFRLYMFKNHSWILEGYYKLGETISSERSPREFDLTIWKQEGKI